MLRRAWKSTAASLRRLVHHAENVFCYFASRLWRRIVTRPTYIAITGSVGKSTCRRCLEAILSQEPGVRLHVGKKNGSPGVYKAVLGARPTHHYALIEIGINGPHQMDRRAGAVRPHVAVELAVAQVHRADLRTLDMVRTQKERLLHALLPGGTAILNGVDPLVRTMASPRVGKTVFFGDVPGSAVRATEVRSSLAEGLRFLAHTPEETAAVQLNLYGTHWIPSVLAALAVARELEIPLSRAAAALHHLVPMPARMQPVQLPNGAILLRDEYNGSLATAEQALAFLVSQPAQRRWIIWSDVSDTAKSPRERIRWLLQRARGHCHGFIFVGALAPLAADMALRSGYREDAVLSFPHLRDAAKAIPQILQSGDLALLRGRTFDHLERLAFAPFGQGQCWKTNCRLRSLCDICPELRAQDPAGNAVKLPLWTPQTPVGTK